MLLAIDAETTGVPLWKLPSSHPEQPHIVQLAAQLIDPETRTARASWDMLVAPNGWTIPNAATAIHGISQERAATEGVNESIAVRTYMDAWAQADVVLGYSTAFDQRIMRIAMVREGMTRPEIEAYERKRAIDVMAMVTPICKIPPTDKMMATGNRTYKTPSLVQAALVLLGERMPGAHNAAHDLEFTLKLYWQVQDLKREANEWPTAYRTDTRRI
jgi:DNA polymerase III subunit epsilon